MLSPAIRSQLRLLRLPQRPVSQLCRFSSTILPEEAAVTAKATITKPLPYFIHRSNSQNLPVYEEAKRGGSLRQTRIRKIEGDVEFLRQQIIEHFNLENDHVFINNLTKHIIIKGHCRQQIVGFLTKLNF